MTHLSLQLSNPSLDPDRQDHLRGRTALADMVTSAGFLRRIQEEEEDDDDTAAELLHLMLASTDLGARSWKTGVLFHTLFTCSNIFS